MKSKQRKKKEERKARQAFLHLGEEIIKVEGVSQAQLYIDSSAENLIAEVSKYKFEPAKGECLSNLMAVHGLWRIPYEPDWILRRRFKRCMASHYRMKSLTRWESIIVKVLEVCSKLKAIRFWFQN